MSGAFVWIPGPLLVWFTDVKLVVMEPSLPAAGIHQENDPISKAARTFSTVAVSDVCKAC